MSSTCPRTIAWLAGAALCLFSAPTSASTLLPAARTGMQGDAPAAEQEEPRPVVVLRGRLVDTNGGALSAVLIEAGEWKYERLDSGDSRFAFEFRTSTDANGQFELGVDPAPAKFHPQQDSDGPMLMFTGPNLLAARLELPRLAAGELDLGNIPLQRGVEVQVNLRGPDGQPLHAGWELDWLLSRTEPRPLGRGNLIQEVSAKIEDRSLTPEGLRIPALQAGRRRLELVHVSGATAKVELMVPAWAPGAGVVEANASYSGPDPSALRIIELGIGEYIDLAPSSPLAPNGIEVIGPSGPLPLWIGLDPSRLEPWAEARDAALNGKRRSPGLFSPDPERLYVLHSGSEPLELRLEDSRYIPLVLPLEPAGSVTKVPLEGNSHLLLQVVDKQSGQAILDYRVELQVGRDFGILGFVEPSDFESEGGQAVAKRVVRGLWPTALKLSIEQEGYRSQEVELPATTPGGLRQLRVELEKAAGATRAEILGALEEGPAPVLFEALLLEDPPAYWAPNYQPSTEKATSAGLVELNAMDWLGDKGRRISLVAGDRMLRLAGPVEVQWPRDAGRLIELALEPSCTLRGALELPAGLRSGILPLRLSRNRIQASISLQTVGNRLNNLAELDPLALALQEESFELKGFARDVYRLHPATPGSDPEAVLAEVDFSAADEIQLDLDVSAHVPAALEVLLPAGLPPVELLLVGPGSEVRAGPSAAGPLSFKSLAPGSYRGALRALGPSGELLWSVALADRIELAPGGSGVCLPKVVLSSGRVRVLTAGGVPLRSQEVWLRFDPNQDPERLVDDSVANRTDSEGWLELSLPAGSYRLFPPGKRPAKRLGAPTLARSAFLDWPTSPDQELRLP